MEKIVAKFALKNQRNFTKDSTYLWMFLFSKHFLKLISECLMVSYSPSRALKNIYGTPQSKQSKAPGKWRNFFLRHPLKIAQKCLFCNFFYIFLLIMMGKLQKI